MKKIISFLYHEVTDNPDTSGFQRPGAIPYKHKVNHFLNDLDIIQYDFSTSIPVNQIENKDEDSLILTFDDGGSSALSIANILSSRNLVGHFFVTTSMIDDSKFLTKDEIVEIHKLGHIIGSHSHNHPSIFTDLSFEEMLNEWLESKKILEDIIGTSVISASVPGGDMNDDTIRSASQAGLKYLFTSEPHYKPYKKHNILVIGRVCTKNTTSSSVIKAWAKGKGFLKAQFIRFCKEIIRTRLKFIYLVYVRYDEGR